MAHAITTVDLRGAQWASIPYNSSAYGSITSDEDAQRYREFIVEFLQQLGWGEDHDVMDGTDAAATLIYAPECPDPGELDFDLCELDDHVFFELMVLADNARDKS